MKGVKSAAELKAASDGRLERGPSGEGRKQTSKQKNKKHGRRKNVTLNTAHEVIPSFCQDTVSVKYQHVDDDDDYDKDDDDDDG